MSSTDVWSHSTKPWATAGDGRVPPASARAGERTPVRCSTGHAARVAPVGRLVAGLAVEGTDDLLASRFLASSRPAGARLVPVVVRAGQLGRPAESRRSPIPNARGRSCRSRSSAPFRRRSRSRATTTAVTKSGSTGGWSAPNSRASDSLRRPFATEDGEADQDRRSTGPRRRPTSSRTRSGHAARFVLGANRVCVDGHIEIAGVIDRNCPPIAPRIEAGASGLAETRLSNAAEEPASGRVGAGRAERVG